METKETHHYIPVFGVKIRNTNIFSSIYLDCGLWSTPIFVFVAGTPLSQSANSNCNTKNYFCPPLFVSIQSSFSVYSWAWWCKLLFYFFADTQTLLSFLQPAPNSLPGIPQFPVSSSPFQGFKGHWKEQCCWGKFWPESSSSGMSVSGWLF